MDALKVTAADFQRNIGRYQDIAQRQPVAVTRNGRDSCILIAVEEYQRLKRRDREVVLIEDFSEDDIELISRSEAPPEAADFDHEVEDA